VKPSKRVDIPDRTIAPPTRRSNARTKRRTLIPRGCGCSTVGGPTEVLKDPPPVEMKSQEQEKDCSFHRDLAQNARPAEVAPGGLNATYPLAFP
jgi:hypothetical protein